MFVIRVDNNHYYISRRKTRKGFSTNVFSSTGMREARVFKNKSKADEMVRWLREWGMKVAEIVEI